MKVNAPGKLILSGEHSVVYGHPALALAVNRYVTATVTEEKGPFSRLGARPHRLSFDLSDLTHHSHLSLDALRHLKKRIKRKYYRFIRGDFRIRDVLQKPFELAQFALSTFAESLQFSLPHSVKLHLRSDIPMGCGMGSSAATILSVMYAISYYLQLPISEELLFKQALDAEKMQHGFTSGLDLRVVLQGGCLYVQGETIEKRSYSLMSMYLINTGRPLASTGECVDHVAKYFKQTSDLGNDFALVTNRMDDSLQNSSFTDFKQAIRDNHQLLVTIGVVPNKVQQFISAVEAADGSGKICGAGSVVGDEAGVVLVVMEDHVALSSLCKQFNYELIPIAIEPRGIHVVK